MIAHEYSTYNVSGLFKDMLPSMKKICHLFDDAIFPKEELDKNIKLAVASSLNMVRSHSALADRIFREVSMGGTPFSLPTDGKIVDVKKLKSAVLKKKLEHFNQQVKKRIYLAGPKGMLDLKKVIEEDCGWKKNGEF